MITPMKTREEFTEQRRQERAAARAQFGDRNVSTVLLKVRNRLTLLKELAWGQAESADAELSSDGWNGLSDTLDELLRDVAMLDNALPADVHNWRPGQGGAAPDGEGGA